MERKKLREMLTKKVMHENMDYVRIQKGFSKTSEKQRRRDEMRMGEEYVLSSGIYPLMTLVKYHR